MRISPPQKPPTEESELHPLAVQRNPMILAYLYKMLAQKMVKFVRTDLKCSEELADNAVFDVLTSYVEQPDGYDPRRGRLLTYLTQAAKYQARTRLRSEGASARREKEFGEVVELWRTPAKEEMENSVEASRVIEKIVKRGLITDEKDMAALKLILMGERSTDRLAEALGLGSLPQEEKRREVKRHRDRLMKILERFRKEDSDEPA